MSPRQARHRRFATIFWAVLLGAALLVVWANHFKNDFHFDDTHTVVDNPAVRSLSNIPRFFSDGRTFSIRPEHYGWRPLVSTTLALDYWMGGGYVPFYFHLSTFIAFLLQLLLMFVLYRHLLRQVDDRPVDLIALFAVAIFGLHPVCAETVNYIVQRADLYVALGSVASLTMYACRPSWRRWCFYLIPFVLAAMFKPTALVFPLLLLSYQLLFETMSLRRKLWAALPSIVVAVGMAGVHKIMTPPTFIYGSSDAYGYLITQPFIAMYYVRSFFWPTALSADTDWTPSHSILDPTVVCGLIFLAFLIVAIVWSARKTETRPIAFGLLWFIIALLPTSLAPLAEVTNDHRMFMPFVGLSLAVVWTTALFLGRSRWVAAAGVVALVALGAATHQRNQVWATERTLWADVVAKSPRNGRGWMNYGLTFLREGDSAEALRCFEEAHKYTPDYASLEINLGLACSQIRGRDKEAESHFQRALQLDAQSSWACFYYGRWLKEHRRLAESAAWLQEAVRRDPQNISARDRLMEVYHLQHDQAALTSLVLDTQRIAPDDAMVNAFSAMLSRERRSRFAVAPLAPMNADTLVNLSLLYFQDGRYQECIDTANQALGLQPGSADAYNNIAAADVALKRWDDAIAAADKAIAIRPDFARARANKQLAEEQRRKGR